MPNDKSVRIYSPDGVLILDRHHRHVALRIDAGRVSLDAENVRLLIGLLIDSLCRLHANDKHGEQGADHGRRAA